MRVLGIDPSPRRTGIALVSFSKKIKPGQRIHVVSHKVICTDTNDDLLKIIRLVSHTITRMGTSGCGTCSPFMETPYLGRNVQALMEQSGLFYGVQILLDEYWKEAIPVNPNQVKTFLGIPYEERGNKDLVVKAVREMVGDAQFLEEKTKPNREAICDAIGIACTGAFLNQ